jgi:Holliday junction resolvase
MINPRNKGKKFEREIAKYLSKRFNTQLRRTPNSGGIEGFMRQDIICMDRDNIMNEFFIECKKRESLNHHKVYWRTENIAPANKIPCVIHSKNHDKEPVITLGLEDFCNLLERIEENKGN